MYIAVIFYNHEMNKVPSICPTIPQNLTRQEADLFVVATNTTYVTVCWGPIPENNCFIPNITVFSDYWAVAERFDVKSQTIVLY